MFQGTVKMYNNTRGFGFIQRDDKQPDAFFHILSVVGGNIHLGDVVTFEMAPARDGRLKAVNVRVLNEEIGLPASFGMRVDQGEEEAA